MDICIFVGRATKDPVIRQTASGTTTASFALAVDTGYGDNKKANFLNMVAFGKTAESIDRFVRQGTRIIVQSEAQQNVWDDKEGKKHYDVNFLIRSWEFAESKKDGVSDGGSYSSQGASQASGTASQPAASAVSAGFVNIPDGIDDEELPFA